MSKQHIEETWSGYWQAVKPPNASEVQREGMRNSFYAGVQGLLSLLVGALSPDREPTEADLQLLDDIDAELEEFVQDLTRKAGN